MGEETTRKQFGQRYLTEDDNVFDKNAWDDVQWDEEQERLACESVQKNSAIAMSPEQMLKYENEADIFWDAFYNIHQNKFFKDRHWLFTGKYHNKDIIIYSKKFLFSFRSFYIEFPELKASHSTTESFNIFEIGCGVGNTILPILKYNNDDNLQVFGCDFSPRAIEILQQNENFDAKRCQVFVLDATAENWQDSLPFSENSVDIIVLIFVLSAIKPDKYLIM